MAKYRKVALIEATQWFKEGDHPAVKTHVGRTSGQKIHTLMTLEELLDVRPGCWIAGPGAKGEFWPIDDEVFQATYELAEGA